MSAGLMASALSLCPAQAETPDRPAPGAAKAMPNKDLGQAMIANQVLRIVIHAPSQLSLFNSRGQLLYKAEAGKGLELVPLKSIELGFVFLTLRQGQVEQTFRLLHDGK